MAASWLVAGLILSFLFSRISTDAFLRALGRADLESYLTTLGLSTLLWFAIDAEAYRHLISRFNVALSGAEARRLRALSYLLTPVHWQLGRAALIARLHQTRGVPLLEATSTLALYQTLDLILLASLALVGTILRFGPGFGSQLGQGPSASVLTLLSISMGTLAGCASLYLYAMASPGSAGTAWLASLRNLRIHHAHRRLAGADAVRIFGLKIVYFGILIAVYWTGLRCFGVELGLARLCISVPIIQAVGALPISPAGLGTQQAAMVLFFATPETEASVIAFGISLPILTIALRCGIGAFYTASGAGREAGTN